MPSNACETLFIPNPSPPGLFIFLGFQGNTAKRKNSSPTEERAPEKNGEPLCRSTRPCWFSSGAVRVPLRESPVVWLGKGVWLRFRRGKDMQRDSPGMHAGDHAKKRKRSHTPRKVKTKKKNRSVMISAHESRIKGCFFFQLYIYIFIGF